MVVPSPTTVFSDTLATCKSLPGLLETTDIAVIYQETSFVLVALVGTGDQVFLKKEEHEGTMEMVVYLLVVNSDLGSRKCRCNV